MFQFGRKKKKYRGLSTEKPADSKPVEEEEEDDDDEEDSDDEDLDKYAFDSDVSSQ